MTRYMAFIVLSAISLASLGCSVVIDPVYGAIGFDVVRPARPRPGRVSGSTYAAQNAFAQLLKNEPVTVRVDSSRIIRDNGHDGVIEIVFAIDHVPRYLPYYELSAGEFDHQQIYVNPNAPPDQWGLLRVERTDAGWAFYDYRRKAQLPTDLDKVIVHIAFLRVHADNWQPPREVWVQLAVRYRKDGVYGCDVIFFFGAIPLQLKASS